MDKEYLNKMKNCSHLLPDPGGEVVRGLIEQVESLQQKNAELVQEKATLVEALEEAQFDAMNAYKD